MFRIRVGVVIVFSFLLCLLHFIGGGKEKVHRLHFFLTVLLEHWRMQLSINFMVVSLRQFYSIPSLRAPSSVIVAKLAFLMKYFFLVTIQINRVHSFTTTNLFICLPNVSYCLRRTPLPFFLLFFDW